MTKLALVLATLGAGVMVSLWLVFASRRARPSDPRRLIAGIILAVSLLSLLAVLLSAAPGSLR